MRNNLTFTIWIFHAMVYYNPLSVLSVLWFVTAFGVQHQSHLNLRHRINNSECLQVIQHRVWRIIAAYNFLGLYPTNTWSCDWFCEVHNISCIRFKQLTKRFHNLEADVKINKQWGIFPTFEVTVLIFFKSPRLQYPGVGNKSPGTDENTVFEFKILDRAQLHTFTYNFINTQLHTIKHCMCVISSAV